MCLLFILDFAFVGWWCLCFGFGFVGLCFGLFWFGSWMDLVVVVCGDLCLVLFCGIWVLTWCLDWMFVGMFYCWCFGISRL